jgi:GTP diphosphokinase / guanosine-3',5'-bis(diphosphate) 3'-diphosphatase
MNIWNQDNYIKAWNYASSVHNGQLIPGKDIPYIHHIGLVAMEAMAAIAHNKNIDSPDLLVLCAILHDTIEDTNSTYNDIQREFGMEVANGVMALSKNTELPAKDEQMRDSLQRIKKEPVEIWMVKLSDRITNLQPPPSHWNKEKIIRYKNEALMILSELGEANKYLAERLKMKIENYGQYE